MRNHPWQVVGASFAASGQAVITDVPEGSGKGENEKATHEGG